MPHAEASARRAIKLKNSLVRLARYASAWLHFSQIRRLTLDNHSVEEVLDATLGYANGFFAPFQVREEILEALEVVRELRPRYIIEIGTAAGGTLLLWSRIAHPEATIVTIDLPGGQFGGGYSRLRAPLLRHLALPGQTIPSFGPTHMIRQQSTWQSGCSMATPSTSSSSTQTIPRRVSGRTTSFTAPSCAGVGSSRFMILPSIGLGTE